MRHSEAYGRRFEGMTVYIQRRPPNQIQYWAEGEETRGLWIQAVGEMLLHDIALAKIAWDILGQAIGAMEHAN